MIDPEQLGKAWWLISVAVREQDALAAVRAEARLATFGTASGHTDEDADHQEIYYYIVDIC